MKKLSKILLSSTVFDVGHVKSAMYCPCVSVYMEFEKKDRPIHVYIKYKWSTIDVFYRFDAVFKKLYSDKGLLSFLKSVITDNLPEYEGEFKIDIENDHFVSKIGREIGFVKDFNTAIKLYQKIIN